MFRTIDNLHSVKLQAAQHMEFNPRDVDFAKKLIENFQKRLDESKWLVSDDKEITLRGKFIFELLNIIEKEDIEAELNQLRDEKIEPFKGIVSQRLYDLCLQRRLELQTRSAYPTKKPGPVTEVKKVATDLLIDSLDTGSTKSLKF